ncbi:neck protein [Vibrio phage 1.029.O._10N.261.55.A7]|nr:neck protein [Vibrio phage 1.029.O._10N.261.55.A7]
MSVTVSGGNKIAEIIAELKRKFRDAPTVMVGVPKSAGNYDDGVHIATIAATNEFGSADGRIPERSAIRNGANNSIQGIKNLYEKMMPEVIDKDLDIVTIQRLVGELVVGNIVQVISEGVAPANALSTIKAKGSSTPLIDSGTYRQSITYVLSEPGDDIQEGL